MTKQIISQIKYLLVYFRIPLLICFLIPPLFYSCAAHNRSNIHSTETFVVEFNEPSSRGGVIETALEGLYFGAKYLSEKVSKSLSSSYSESISIHDYYTRQNSQVRKTYESIEISKFAKPILEEQSSKVKALLENDLQKNSNARGLNESLTRDKLIRIEKDDFLNFHAVVGIESLPDNPTTTRLAFNEVEITFSKTKVFSDEDLNIRLSILLEGQWLDDYNNIVKQVLCEQEFLLKDLSYGIKNQLENPIYSQWYQDLPVTKNHENLQTFGLIRLTVQLDEYEGNRSRYLSKIPSILSDNKNALISNGSFLIGKFLNPD